MILRHVKPAELQVHADHVLASQIESEFCSPGGDVLEPSSDSSVTRMEALSFRCQMLRRVSNGSCTDQPRSLQSYS